MSRSGKPITIRPYADGTADVTSGPNTYHVDANALRCDCRGWSPKRPCRHLRAVLGRLEATTAG